MKRRELLEAATYRKFRFQTLQDMYDWLNGGHLSRWIVSFSVDDNNLIVAVVGEAYNNSEILKMTTVEGK